MTATIPQPDTKPAPRARPTLAERHKLRVAYVHGEGPLTRLCARFGISYGTARQWHDAEKWPELRRSYDAKRVQSVLNEASPAQPSSVTSAPPAQQASNSKLETLDNQLARVDEALKDCEDAKEWDSLTRAKDRLLANFYVLAGIPKPGSRRHKPEPTRPVRSSVEPL